MTMSRGWVALAGMMFTLLATGVAYSHTVEVNAGTVELLDGYVAKHTGTVDSWRGEFHPPGGDATSVIHCDIGHMAGTHVSQIKKHEYGWYREQRINGHLTRAALIRDKTGPRVAVTIYGEEHEPWGYANFWSYDTSDRGVAELMLTALSFKGEPGVKPEDRPKGMVRLVEAFAGFNSSPPHKDGPPETYTDMSLKWDLFRIYCRSPKADGFLISVTETRGAKGAPRPKTEKVDGFERRVYGIQLKESFLTVTVDHSARSDAKAIAGIEKRIWTAVVPVQAPQPAQN